MAQTLSDRRKEVKKCLKSLAKDFKETFAADEKKQGHLAKLKAYLKETGKDSAERLDKLEQRLNDFKKRVSEGHQASMTEKTEVKAKEVKKVVKEDKSVKLEEKAEKQLQAKAAKEAEKEKKRVETAERRKLKKVTKKA